MAAEDHAARAAHQIRGSPESGAVTLLIPWHLLTRDPERKVDAKRTHSRLRERRANCHQQP
jgi:hypothetical protein